MTLCSQDGAPAFYPPKKGIDVMNTQTHIHEPIAWAKQRLDELDAGIAAAEKSLDEVNGDIRREADDALARLREARGKLQVHYDKLRAETGATKQGVKAVQDALEAEWVEVEAAFHSFTSAVGEHAQTARGIVLARVKAQRSAWEASLQELRGQTADAVEKARAELDAAIKRVSDEAEKFQTRIGEVKDAGDASWEAVKSGLEEAKQVHSRTIQKIRDALSKPL